MITRKHGGGKRLGVRHLQLVFAHIHSLLDGIGMVGTHAYLNNVRIADVFGTRNEERLFAESETRLIETLVFITMAVTRVLAPFIILSLNNKYLSIVLTFLEVLIYVFLMQAYSLTKYYGVVTVCVVLSACQAIRFPIALNMIAKWIPPREHSRALVVVYMGTPFGQAFLRYLLFMPSFKQYFFYILACLKAVHIVAYFFFGAQDPQTCWILRKTEWHYLCKEIGYRRKIQCACCRRPWRNILRTPIIYGLMCSSIASSWFFVDFINFKKFVPGYDDAINISIMIYPFLQFAAAWGVDEMIYKEIITRNNLRKICSCFVLWGSSIAICFMCFYSRETHKIVAYFIIAVYFSFGFVISEMATVFDLSPNYAVELHAIYTFPSWVVAALKIAFIDPKYHLKGEDSFRENLYVWYSTAFVMFVLNYGFLMFGYITWCQFDTFNAVDWRKESQISYP